MALSILQIDVLLDAASAALAKGMLSFETADGHKVVFHSLKQQTDYIDWLNSQRSRLTDESAAASGDASYAAPVVRFLEAGR